ncbi:hypothetical protein HDA40_000680 [Hamadaea flava]|uniref:M23 family metallopeptidase n=2 Tax=Hamadaea TaxID=1121254 RepID=A0ABV8M143_9ACTN|nr:M23 family metallopeptidase [Hamadaea flava]MCP2322173.1 hypothetical protein [Hamadaea flava]
MRKHALRLAAIVALLLASVMAPSMAQAHQSSSPSPNGESPWLYSDSWVLSGSWYGEGLHTDYCGSPAEHCSDYYALDFSKPSAPCYQALYPIWDGMTVATVDRTIGRLTMTKKFGTVTWRVKYMHMDTINYNPGAVVGTTTVVGKTGNKGQSSGCHLHISTQAYDSASGAWVSHPPQFCGRTYPHDHTTAWKGC